MSLPQSNSWRKLARVTTGASPTIQDVIDLINTAFTSATYYDGSTRTPGSGSAWTATIDGGTPRKYVYLTPPVDPGQAQRVVFAGSSAAETPTMAPQGSTYTANALHTGINLDSGAFATWDAALPFTSGRFSGYWNDTQTIAGANACQLDCYESQHSVMIVGTQSSKFWTAAGAWWDPESAAALDAEADGRVYGMWVGFNWEFKTDWISNGAAGYPFAHFNGFGAPHNGSFSPGGSFNTFQNRNLVHTAPSNLTHTLRSGVHLGMGQPEAQRNSDGVTIGMYRGIRYCRNMINGQVFRDGGLDKGYAIGPNWTAPAQSAMLLTGL